MKKGHHLPRPRVDTCQIRAFVQIAAVARQREIISIIRAPVLLSHDVFNMVREAALLLVQTAIFATPASPQPDEVPRRRIHLLLNLRFQM